MSRNSYFRDEFTNPRCHPHWRIIIYAPAFKISNSVYLSVLRLTTLPSCAFSHWRRFSTGISKKAESLFRTFYPVLFLLSRKK